jgi:hypothetical protein
MSNTEIECLIRCCTFARPPSPTRNKRGWDNRFWRHRCNLANDRAKGSHIVYTNFTSNLDEMLRTWCAGKRQEKL